MRSSAGARRYLSEMDRDSSPTPVLRTRSQAILIVLVGVIGCVALFSMALARTPRTARHALSTGDRAVGVILGLIVLGGCLRLAYCAAVVRPDGLFIRNPARSIVVPWSEVRGFRLGRSGLWPMVCVLQRMDGREVAIWAIQDLGPAVRRPGRGAATGLVHRLEAAREQRSPPH